MNIKMAVICFAYVLSPIDLVPEAVLGPLGIPDDILAGILGLRALVMGGGKK